jgi:RNA polymerase sigma factor (sigma-70 family)
MESAAVNDPTADDTDVTVLLMAASRGDAPAIDRLMPLVYNQLRADAQNKLSRERHGGAGQTLSATALVHEAYLKLVGPREVPWQGRGHFYAAAAEAMRRILIDRARAKFGRAQGGAGGAGGVGMTSSGRRAALSLTGAESLAVIEDDSAAAVVAAEGLLALDEAVERLAAEDRQAATVLRLRLFTGLSVEETALALGVSDRTVKRAWQFARSWLQVELQRE